MNLPAGDLALRGPGIERRGFDLQLFSEFFDRQQHRDTNRGSLTTPLIPPTMRPRVRRRRIRTALPVGASRR